jgi:hypothetical protein
LCNSKLCTVEDCCVKKETCIEFQCPAHKVPRESPDNRYCSNVLCNPADNADEVTCCADRGTCTLDSGIETATGQPLKFDCNDATSEPKMFQRLAEVTGQAPCEKNFFSFNFLSHNFFCMATRLKR